MTVGELRKLLEVFPQDAPVVLRDDLRFRRDGRIVPRWSEIGGVGRLRVEIGFVGLTGATFFEHAGDSPDLGASLEVVVLGD